MTRTCVVLAIGGLAEAVALEALGPNPLLAALVVITAVAAVAVLVLEAALP